MVRFLVEYRGLVRRFRWLVICFVSRHMNSICWAWASLVAGLSLCITDVRAATSVIPEGHRLIRAVERDDVETLARALRSGEAGPLVRISGKTRERLFDRALTRGSERVFGIMLRSLKAKGVPSRKLSDARGTPALLSLATLAVPGSPRVESYQNMAQAYLKTFPGSLYERDRAYVGDGRLPTHGAAAVGNQELLRIFLLTGADPNVRNATGETPLHLAARHGHLAVVRELIGRGARVNAQTRFTHATPLLYAAELGRKPVIRLLLAAGAKKASRDVFGKTAKQRYREFSMNSEAQRPARQ